MSTTHPVAEWEIGYLAVDARMDGLPELQLAINGCKEDRVAVGSAAVVDALRQLAKQDVRDKHPSLAAEAGYLLSRITRETK